MSLRTLTALVVAAALTLVGCSSSGSSPAAKGSTTTAGPATTTASSAPVTTSGEVPEAFTGDVTAFSTPPSPLPKGQPGAIIRIQPVSTTDDAVTVRVMYHSIDGAGRDQPVIGIITYPTATPPAGGWPVTASAPGTVGLNDSCAVSRRNQPAPGFGVQGVHVETDYIGMVQGDRLRYLSGASEAHSVIDAVRAARNLPDTHAGIRWVAVGASQGGHAALFTHQLGTSYAPELELLGTVAVAPAAELTKTFGPDDQVIPRMVGIMGLFGIAGDHPEVDPADYIGPVVAEREGVIDTGCLNDIIKQFAPIQPDTFYSHDPQKTEPAKSIIAENDPGQVAVEEPLLLAYGTKDIFVIPARALSLFDRLCKVGQETELFKIEGAEHSTTFALGGTVINQWVADRFAGKKPVDSCSAATN